MQIIFSGRIRICINIRYKLYISPYALTLPIPRNSNFSKYTVLFTIFNTQNIFLFKFCFVNSIYYKNANFHKYPQFNCNLPYAFPSNAPNSSQYKSFKVYATVVNTTRNVWKIFQANFYLVNCIYKTTNFHKISI